jgi:hypothetical protein
MHQGVIKLIDVHEVNAGDLVAWATIRTDEPTTIGFGIAIRRLTASEIAGNLTGLSGTTGAPPSAWWVNGSTGPVAVAGNMITSLVKADKTAWDVLAQMSLPTSTAPSDAPGW